MDWYGSDVNGWGYALMAVGMLAFWALVIIGLVLLVRQRGSAGQLEGSLPALRAPEQLLAERFARGEIEEREYGDRLAILHGQVRS